MALDAAVRIARGLAAALEPIGVHGELWPSAILVSDAGVALVPSGASERARFGQYAAPERILGKPASAASDVFSAGAILFHALAGRPPFSGQSPSEVMLAVCAGDAPLDLHALRGDVSPEAAAVIQKCLSANPAARYPTVAAMAQALEASSVRGAFPGKRILVADDDAPIRDFYTCVAGRIGVEADVVASGRDAVAALKSRRYDVALLDLNMPRLSGWEVLDFLRMHAETRPVRLFIVTGFADQRLSEADRELVTAVIYKPVAAEELKSLVVECLRGGNVDVRSILRTTGHRITPAA